MRSSLGGPRVLLRRLREVMAEPVSAQARLDKIVMVIAANMVAEVCSFYVMRAGGTPRYGDRLYTDSATTIRDRRERADASVRCTGMGLAGAAVLQLSQSTRHVQGYWFD